MEVIKFKTVFALFVLLFLFLTISAQQVPVKFRAARTENTNIVAVPVPGKVTIDGKLDDWDLSGGILTCMDVNNYLDKYSGWVYMMYDNEALYVSAKVTDNTPLRNGYDPDNEPVIVHRGDCFYLRFKEDQMVTNLFGFFNSKIKQPCMVMAEGVDWYGTNKYSNGINRGVQESFQLNADGKGYTQELRIPWNLITGSRIPKVGEKIPMLLGIYWSNAGERDHFIYNSYDVVGKGQELPGAYYWKAGDVWGELILSKEGNVKLPVYPWLQPLPVEPKPLAFNYNLPKDGDVTIALVNEEGKMVRHIVTQATRKAGNNKELWNGLDDLGKPIPAGNYTWKGIYHDPITTKYSMGIYNSGQPTYKVEGGTGQWGADHGEPPTSICTAGNEMILGWQSAEAGSPMIKTSSEGKKMWGKSLGIGAEYLASDGEWIYASDSENPQEVCLYAVADAHPLIFGNGQAKITLPLENNQSIKKNKVTGMAYANGDGLYSDSVLMASRGVSGLAVDKGVLYVSYISRNVIALFDAKNGTLKSTWQVPAPGQLVFLSDGKFAVVSNGKVVLVNNGKVTPFISDHLDKPTGITADKQGLVYVANQGQLQNISVFSAKGKFVKSIGIKGGRPLFGAYNPNGVAKPIALAIDVEDRLWVAECDGYPKRFSLWNTKSGGLYKELFGATEYCTPVSIDPVNPSEALCLNSILDIDIAKGIWYPKSNFWYKFSHGPKMFGASSGRLFTASNGRQYAVETGWENPGKIAIRDGLLIKPVVRILEKNKKFFLWQDLNDDQLEQSEELIPIGYERFTWSDNNLTLWSDRGWKLSPSRIEPNGRPVYDVNNIQKLPPMYAKNEASFGLFQNAWFYSEGALITNNAGTEIFTVEASASDDLTGIRGYTPEGKERWYYHTGACWPRTMQEPIPKPGQIYAITKMLGVGGDYLAIMTYFGVFNIFTTDGLFVAKLFHDAREGILGPEVICAEMFVGGFIKTEKTGQYFMLGGDTDGRITEVLGLNSVQRFNGTYSVSADDAKKVEKEMTEFKSFQSQACKLVIAKGESALNSTSQVGKESDNSKGFTTHLAYDDKNLYVLYDVKSNSELVNSISNPQTIFKGGNCIDIQIGTDVSADPKRTAPVPGDMRLLISQQNEKPYAVLYQPKMQGFKGTPIILSSPTGKMEFDAIIVVSDQIKIDYHKHDVGFNARITIPLDLLGWKPQSGTSVKIDLGYLFGSSAGNSCGLRLYWTNKSFSSGVIGDVPNESRLEPAEWGEATVE